MTLQSVIKRYTAGSKGLITEGNELAGPEDSTLKDVNYERLTDQTARRKRAILEETLDRALYRPVDYSALGPIPYTENRFRNLSSFIWKTPAHAEGFSVLVEEVGHRIRFYRMDHDVTDDAGQKQYMRQNRYSDEVWLELWGQSAISEVELRDRRPCTYAEGDGSLYIFNNTSGTIRVDLTSVDGDTAEGVLQFTPIGTWIRDYSGAAEDTLPNHRHQGTDEATAPGQLYNGQPIPVGTLPGARYITDELPDNRAYNLTNTGWPEKDIATFKENSEEDYRVYSQFRLKGSTLDADSGRYFVTKQRNDYEYPALQDRYLDGRNINEDGQDVFLFSQLNEAQERTGEPTRGGRIGHSDYHPAGTLQPTPVDHLAAQAGSVQVTNEAVATMVGTNIRFTIQYNDPQFHSFGRSDDNVAIFVHQCTFVVTLADEDGNLVERVGGFSGVVDAVKVSGGTADHYQLTFDHDLGQIGAVANMTSQNSPTPMSSVTQPGTFWAHPSPLHTAHRLPDNGEFFDYRRRKRPTSGAFYANRLWQLADEHSRVYYSQMVSGGNNRNRNSSMNRESLCYTSASPTDGEDSAVVATDGGYIYLPDSGTMLGAEVLGTSLYIMTDNGIHTVQPGGAGFFLPTDFRVQKVVDAEVLGQKAWVNTGIAILVMTDQGILRISAEGIENLTTRSILSRYDELVQLHQYTDYIAAFDPDSQVARFAFSPEMRTRNPDGSVYSVNSLNNAMRDQGTIMLNYSERFSHWYEYELSKGGAVSEMVVIPYTQQVETYNRFRYLCVTEDNFDTPRTEWGVEAEFDMNGTLSWIEGSLDTFRDYRDLPATPDHNEIQAEMITNHQMYGEGHNFSQIKYVVVFNRNVTSHLVQQVDLSYENNVNGSTLVQAMWDWSDQENRGQYSGFQETYKFRRSFITQATTAVEDENRGEPLLAAKIKIRGRGREFRLHYLSQTGLDSHIVGWNIEGLVLSKT